jgi:hypothetical protein
MAVKNEQVWQTWWSIIGPSLPECEERLLNQVVLGPVPEISSDGRKTLRAPNLNLPLPKNRYYVKHLPPTDEVSSDHKLQIDVLAGSQDQATELAQEIADRLITSLTLTVGERYYAELRMLRIKDSTKELSAWSQTLAFRIFNKPTAMSRDILERATHIYRALNADETIENAYRHLLTAWQLQATSGSKPLQRSTLQHYVLALEAVVNTVMTENRKLMSDNIRVAERAFADTFTRELPSRADKPKAIREASTKLREIAYQNMLPTIDWVASDLNIEKDICSLAKELYRLRSSSLSHPGRLPVAQLNRWLAEPKGTMLPCLADKVARTFVLKWCMRRAQLAG